MAVGARGEDRGMGAVEALRRGKFSVRIEFGGLGIRRSYQNDEIWKRFYHLKVKRFK